MQRRPASAALPDSHRAVPDRSAGHSVRRGSSRTPAVPPVPAAAPGTLTPAASRPGTPAVPPPPKARCASRACRSPHHRRQIRRRRHPRRRRRPGDAPRRSSASRSAIAQPTCGSSCPIRVRYCRTASHSPSGTARQIQRPRTRPTSHGGGGGSAIPPRATGIRSRTTSVPANTSPSRRPRADTSEAMHATTPNVIRISMTPIAPRTSACRNRIGPPSSRTTRSPQASFPSDRPGSASRRRSVPPTSTSTNVATDTAATAASSSEDVALTSTSDDAEVDRPGHDQIDQPRPAPGSAASPAAAPAPPPHPSRAHSRRAPLPLDPRSPAHPTTDTASLPS